VRAKDVNRTCVYVCMCVYARAFVCACVCERDRERKKVFVDLTFIIFMFKTRNLGWALLRSTTSQMFTCDNNLK